MYARLNCYRISKPQRQVYSWLIIRHKYFCLVCLFSCILHICILRSLFNVQNVCTCRKPHKPPQILFHLEQLSFVVFWCSRIQGHIRLLFFHAIKRLPSSRGTKVEKMLTLAPERYTAGFCMVAKAILWCI